MCQSQVLNVWTWSQAETDEFIHLSFYQSWGEWVSTFSFIVILSLYTFHRWRALQDQSLIFSVCDDIFCQLPFLMEIEIHTFYLKIWWCTIYITLVVSYPWLWFITKSRKPYNIFWIPSSYMFSFQYTSYLNICICIS